MKVLILGGAGFVGGNVAFYLSRQGFEVQVMDNLVRRGSEINVQRFRESNIAFRHGDVRNEEDFVGLEADIVLDCAAQPSAIDGYANPSYDFTNNTYGVLNTLKFCQENDAGLIFWSTNKVYPQQHVHYQKLTEWEMRFSHEMAIGENCPLDGGDRSLYGCSKVMADLMIQEWSSSFGLPAIVNRFSCLAGPWQWGKCEQGWVAWWVIAHHLSLPLQYIGFKGKQVRDVLFIDDLCRLIERQISAIDNGSFNGCQAYNVGGGKYNTLSLRECTDIVQNVTGRRVPITHVEEPRRADFCVYVSDTSKVERDFSWFPQTLNEEGIEEIHRWVINNHSLLSKMYLPHRGKIGEG